MSDTGKLNVVKVRKTLFTESASARNLEATPVVPGEEDLVREEAGLLLEILLRRIVPEPNDVSVSFAKGERTTVYKVECSKNNFSYILGKQGKTIDALRKVVSVITSRHGIRSVVEIPYY